MLTINFIYQFFCQFLFLGCDPIFSCFLFLSKPSIQLDLQLTDDISVSSIDLFQEMVNLIFRSISAAIVFFLLFFVFLFFSSSLSIRLVYLTLRPMQTRSHRLLSIYGHRVFAMLFYLTQIMTSRTTEVQYLLIMCFCGHYTSISNYGPRSGSTAHLQRCCMTFQQL